MGWLIALLAGGLGAFAFWRRRRRRGEPEPSPADELKAKLAESRETGEEPEAAAEPGTENELQSDLDARRREVHDRARGAIDDLSS